MKAEYDLSTMKARKNPYVSKLKKAVNLRLSDDVLTYFKEMETELGVPYQSLINLYLRDCVGSSRVDAINVIESRDGVELVRRMNKAGSIVAAQVVAENMIRAAQDALIPLPPGQVKSLLQELAMEVIRRDR